MAYCLKTHIQVSVLLSITLDQLLNSL